MSIILSSQNSFLIDNRFVIEDPSKNLLGSGSMGDVYLGWDNLIGQNVAIKVLRKGNSEAPASEIISRFLREGKALRRLKHPNIVEVVDTVTVHSDSNLAADDYYIIMEYVEGGTLADLLNQSVALPMEQALDIGLDLSDALTRAHRLGIIHRDVKPGNVLMSNEGTPRLTDFGLALLADSTSLTKSGTLMGTVNYLSPEACNGESLDETSDIWSFAVLLWEMLTGRQPFRRDNIGATLTAILSEPLPDFSQVYPGAPDALVLLLSSMLAKDRRHRISRMRLVGLELETILEQLQETDEPPNEQLPWAQRPLTQRNRSIQGTGLSNQVMVDSIIDQGLQGEDQILDETSLVFIYSNRDDLEISEVGYNILLRSSIFHGEPYEAWLDALSSTEVILESLLSFYGSYPRPEVRSRIVEAMSLVPCPEVGQALLDIALHDEAPSVKANAALAAAQCGFREQVTAETLAQAEQGQDVALAAQVALADAYGVPPKASRSLRTQIAFAVALKRWRVYRGDVWRQSVKVSLGASLMVFYGASVPLVMRFTLPETYAETLAYLSLTAYFLVSMIMFGIFGLVQGFILGFGVSVGDALQLRGGSTWLRTLLGMSAGLISGLYFSATQLLSGEPVPADASLVFGLNILYGLVLGWILSRVIPPFYAARPRREQTLRIGKSILLSILIAIPYVLFIFEDLAVEALLSRLLLAVMLPVTIGIPFIRHADQAGQDRS